MLEMSGMRFFGIALGLTGLLITFFYYRGTRWKRTNFILLFAVNACLIIICLNPNVINILRDMLAMKTSERGRLLSLLVVTVLFLLFLVLYLKLKLDTYIFEFDNLVRALGNRNLAREEKEKIREIMVVIPAYNEEENLKLLLPKIPHTIGKMKIGILIVDDNSEDNTSQLRGMFDCLIVKNPINRGQGAALRLGYDIIRNNAVEICVTMDADNQHSPEDIPRLLEPIANDEADLVIGSRTIGSDAGTTPARSCGLILFNSIINRLLQVKISDCSSGFRAFRTNILDNMLLREAQYQSSELIIEAVKKGNRIKEVPVSIGRRYYGKSKKGTNIKYGINFARVILKTWWRR